MKVRFEEKFISDLDRQVRYISWDKPMAARKFKTDLLKNLRKDLKFPFHFKKSIYFEDELVRDYVFKGYTCIYEINSEDNIVAVIGLIKYMETFI
jgi:plasmid stabilization system protein ParE